MQTVAAPVLRGVIKGPKKEEALTIQKALSNQEIDDTERQALQQRLMFLCREADRYQS